MGSNPLANYGQAREGAYFKTEQEANLQRYARRLAKENQLQIMAGGKLQPRQEAPPLDSERSFEVLPEIMQQAARINDPHAAARREFTRKVRGSPAKLTEAELARYRSTVYGTAAAIGHVPRMSFGRDRYGMAASAAQEITTPQRPLSPEAVELGRRTYLAGVRALVYGSLLGAAAVALGLSFALRAMEVNSMEDFRGTMRGFAEPAAQRMQRRLVPLKARIQEFMGRQTDAEGNALYPSDAGARASQSTDSEFSRRLAGKFSPKSPRMRALNPVDSGA